MCINCQYLEFRVVSGLGCVGAKLNGCHVLKKVYTFLYKAILGQDIPFDFAPMHPSPLTTLNSKYWQLIHIAANS